VVAQAAGSGEGPVPLVSLNRLVMVLSGLRLGCQIPEAQRSMSFFVGRRFPKLPEEIECVQFSPIGLWFPKGTGGTGTARYYGAALDHIGLKPRNPNPRITQTRFEAWLSDPQLGCRSRDSGRTSALASL
jgi:hypothetical protein